MGAIVPIVAVLPIRPEDIRGVRSDNVAKDKVAPPRPRDLPQSLERGQRALTKELLIGYIFQIHIPKVVGHPQHGRVGEHRLKRRGYISTEFGRNVIGSVPYLRERK